MSGRSPFLRSREMGCLFSPCFVRVVTQLASATKFCHVRGIRISVKDEDLFCVAQLEVESSERKRHQTTTLTFEEYRERKERNEPPGLLLRKAATLKSLFVQALSG